MNVLLVLAFVVLVSSAFGASTYYTTRFDHVDLDEILKNERLYKKYYECLIGTGKCTPDGRELKEKLPEALANNCQKCTTAQKQGATKVMEFVRAKRPEHFVQLQKIYDPQGIYLKRFEAEKKST